jgi:hypothetical protein
VALVRVPAPHIWQSPISQFREPSTNVEALIHGDHRKQFDFANWSLMQRAGIAHRVISAGFVPWLRNSVTIAFFAFFRASSSYIGRLEFAGARRLLEALPIQVPIKFAAELLTMCPELRAHRLAATA